MNAAWGLLFLCVTASCAQAETPPPKSPAPAAAPAHLPTALDVMVAHQRELQLRPEQLARVQALGAELDATNAPLEQSLAKLQPEQAPAASSSETPPSGQPVGRRGGRGAFRGGGRGGMAGGRSGRQGRPRPQAPARPHPDQAETLRARMADNHAAAVARAFGVLDEAQQDRAAQLLDENDFEPPTVDDVRAARQDDAHHVTGP